MSAAQDDQYIYLGSFLDQLLNRDCKLTSAGLWGGGKQRVGGLRVPREAPWTPSDEGGGRAPLDPGSGNIVIMGGPGSGKTTLALHMAQACCQRPDNRKFLAAYISLEEELYRVQAKAKLFGWNHLLQQLYAPHDVSTPPDAMQMASWLRDAIDWAKQKMPRGEAETSGVRYAEPPRPILVPRLSPRSLDDAKDDNSLFWYRYRQLESLLRAAQTLRRSWEEAIAEEGGKGGRKRGRRERGSPAVLEWEEKPSYGYDLRLVVVDSMSVFGDRLLSREELFRVFDLFSRTGVIGVVIAEDKSAFGPGVDDQHMETIDSLADVVIELTATKEKGYFRRTIEINKSRYASNVLGKHAAKIFSLSKDESDPFAPVRQVYAPVRDRVGFVALPSMHYYLSQESLPSVSGRRSGIDERLKFGHDPLANVLPPGYRGNWAVTVAGPRHTYKTALAVNYLLRGAWAEEGAWEGQPETVLLIRLHDNTMFDPRDSFVGKARLWEGFQSRWASDGPRGAMLLKSSTAALAAWRMRCDAGQLSAEPIGRFHDIATNYRAGTFIELTLRTGAQFAEDAVAWIWELVHQCRCLNAPIRRAVLDDISRIAISYPFLEDSETSQRLFITGIVHLFRQQQIGLVIVGTTGEHPAADEIVQRARNASDTVIYTGHSIVFGTKHVTITGEGIFGKPVGDDHDTEPVPLTIRGSAGADSTAFEIDGKQFSGLVGFDDVTGSEISGDVGGGAIFRAGARIYLFEEDPRHRHYNDQVEYLLQLTFGTPPPNASVHENDTRENDASEDKQAALAHRHAEVASCRDHGIRILRFGAERAETTFDATAAQSAGVPADTSVVFALDEFAADDSLQENFLPLFQNGQMPDPHSKLYYRNVLMAVIRDTLKSHPWWRSGGLTWQGLADNVQGIYYDRKAKETLTSLFLDAMFEARPPYPFDGIDDFVGYIEHLASDMEAGTDAVVRPLIALTKILGRATPHKDDADVLICWFSQVRDLLHYPESKNRVAPRQQWLPLEAVALPGRGFTGDWRLGVLKGSLSPKLGERIIEVLCSKQEQYNRLLLGIGLPASECFDEEPGTRKFMAIDVDSEHSISLRTILAIHQEARQRRTIPEYFRIRKLLHHTAMHLMRIGIDNRGTEADHILLAEVGSELKRLAAMIPSLCDMR